MAWLYVPESADSNLESTSQSETPTEPCVTSSGRPTRRPLSWRGWKTRPWIERLSGTTSRPSMAARGAARWISSLPDSPVSHSAMPESDAARPTSDGSGKISLESLAKYDPATSSWRTCEESSPLLNETPSEPFSGRWPISGTMRSGTCSARPRSARRTGGKGSSCWATPTSRDWKDGANPSESVATNGLLGRQAPRWAKLPGMVRNHHGHRGLDADPRTGPKASLNPQFVERLMGFPPNWSIARIGYEVSATEWSRWLRLMRSALSQIASSANTTRG